MGNTAAWPRCDYCPCSQSQGEISLQVEINKGLDDLEEENAGDPRTAAAVVDTPADLAKSKETNATVSRQSSEKRAVPALMDGKTSDGAEDGDALTELKPAVSSPPKVSSRIEKRNVEVTVGIANSRQSNGTATMTQSLGLGDRPFTGTPTGDMLMAHQGSFALGKYGNDEDDDLKSFIKELTSRMSRKDVTVQLSLVSDDSIEPVRNSK